MAGRHHKNPRMSREEKQHHKLMMREYAQNALRKERESDDFKFTLEMQDGTASRADRVVLQTLRTLSPIEVADFFAAWSNRDEHLNIAQKLIPYIYVSIAKDTAKEYFQSGHYEDAIEKYKEAMRHYMGKDAVLPSPNFLNDTYLSIDRYDIRQMEDLIACAGNICQCYRKLGKLVEALDWAEEVEQVYMGIRLMGKPNDPSWINYHLNFVEYFTLRMKSRYRQFEIFKSLGNTSMAAFCSNEACKQTYMHEGQGGITDRIISMRRMDNQIDIVQLRHPDPSKLYDLEITEPTLQIQGVWRKLEVEGHKPPSRSSCSSWIWKGKLYIVGGLSDMYTEHRDSWCLTLSTMRWRRLPDMPQSLRPLMGLNCSRLMAQNGDKAYLFAATQNLWQFDMTTEKWTSLKTTFAGPGKWPYTLKYLNEFNSAVVDNKLYIFGGDDDVTQLGCNILMCLDLKTLRWKHISGTSQNIPCITEPNCRVLSAMWAVPEQHKLYLVGGAANRSMAYQKHLPGGNPEDYTYEDFWSFDCTTEKWTREHFRGNHVCPRSEMAYTYNPVLRQGIVYGGYNASLYSAVSSKMYQFTFYGDSFIFDRDTKIWKHVIAKGVPSYRAQSSLICDPETGATYLFGGYVNTEYVPHGQGTVECHNDIWQLKLDMTGGLMTEEDRQIDCREETMGPWRRCYTCGSAGLNYKKCAGTCGGRYFFCSKECQIAGWPEHKEAQGCRKIA